ncbi:TPA: hypothetical protein ACTW6H_005609, partial [Raoultella ornithinolytica]
MTSKLTREQLHERARENVKALKMASRQHAFESAREEILADLQLAELALAAMDSEPVYQVLSNDAWIDLSKGAMDAQQRVGAQVRTLYRHAQPVQTVQPVMFIDGDISSEDADKLAKVIREFNEEDERPLAKMARIIRENPHPTNECDMPKAQPVPDDYQHLRELYHAQEKRLFKIAQRIKGPAFDKYSHSPSQAIDVLEVAIFGEDEACRAAMLQES